MNKENVKLFEPKSEEAYRNYPHHLDNPDNIRLIQSRRRLTKAEKKLIKSRVMRIWVESNPKINILTYFYYRIKDRAIIKMINDRYGVRE